LRRLNPAGVRRFRTNDRTSGDGVESCWRRETDSAAAVCALQLSASTGRRLVPPKTAVPSRVGEEPWRERPRIARRVAVPRAFEGSLTPRFLVSQSVHGRAHWSGRFASGKRAKDARSVRKSCVADARPNTALIRGRASTSARVRQRIVGVNAAQRRADARAALTRTIRCRRMATRSAAVFSIELTCTPEISGLHTSSVVDSLRLSIVREFSGGSRVRCAAPTCRCVAPLTRPATPAVMHLPERVRVCASRP
jgi:hypothetical protein